MADTNFTPQEIEQFLQQFFDVVGARQYVGARYVPIFGRAGEDTVEWDDGAPYEPLTVVMHEGVSYVSRRYVPTGIQITDTSYWAETYRFNAQVEQYRQEVLGFQGQIDQLRDDMESDYVPFPDPDTYPKYGLLGQVLTTLTGGATKWEDPVTVDAAIAEPLIEAWLDDHPEATTTVQDGSITDAKINDNSTIVRFRSTMTNETVPSLAQVYKTGMYSSNTSAFNPTDAPEPNLGLSEMLVMRFHGSTDCMQVIRLFSNGNIYVRTNQSEGSRPGVWRRIVNAPITDADVAANSTIPINHGDLAADFQDLKTLTVPGTYSSRNAAFQPTDAPVSDLGLCEVVVLRMHGSDTLQAVRKYSDGRVWTRTVNTSSVATAWRELALAANVLTANNEMPADAVNLASLRVAGDYHLDGADWDQVMDGTSPDFPTDAGRGIYGLQNHIVFNGSYLMQILTNAFGKQWMRSINRNSGDVYRTWIVTHDPDHIVTTDVLAGKKLVTAGDSYTHAHYADEPEYDGKNYGYYVAQRYGMSFVNSGISGSIMALSKEYVDDPQNVPINSRSPFSYQRYLQVPSDADYLTIWFGINDAAHTYLGTIDDTTNETFYGAWNTVLEYYLTNRPFLKIGLIVTTGALPEYRQAVRDVAEKWGYPYLDWERDVQVPAFFQREGMSATAQNLRREAFGYNDYSAHPSPQWHEYASSIYENFLRSL